MDPEISLGPPRNDATSIDRLGREGIRARLRPSGCWTTHLAALDHPDARHVLHPAAVLLTLYRQARAWHLIFIRRAEQAGDRHSGEVGFPGGRWQPGDETCAATALREAQEEIGLPGDQVELLGELNPVRTVSEYLVTPVVGCIPWPQALTPEPREVARIFSIPLAWLVAPGRHRIRSYPAPDHPEARDLIFFDAFEGERLWGVSARIALDLIARLTRN